MTLLAFAVGILAILIVVQYFWNRRRNELVANINGPIAFPLFGSLHEMYTITPKNFLVKGGEAHQKWGKTFKVPILNRLLLFVSDPKIAEVLLTSQAHITKHRLYNLLKPWLGTGLLLSDGQKWHSRRKIITPTFHFKILEQFVEVYDQQSSILVKQLEKHCDSGKQFDVYPFICLAALDIITETAMGTKINAQTDFTNAYTRAVTDITEIMSMRFLRLHLNDERAFSLFSPRIKRRQTQCINTMHSFTRKVIEERRASLQDTLNQHSKDQTTSPADDIGSKKRMALLDVLLQSTIEGRPLTNEDIREEVDTFMFEGHDTTTSAISFALTLIARYPKVQEKLFAEICEVLGKDPMRPISHRLLQDLKYTECAIKETLRLYPSVPVIGRELMQDLPYDGGVLPKNSEILLGIWSIGRDGDVFPDPEEFRPERHEMEASERSSPFSFVPFSAGPRNCIGQKFAMLEMKSIITKIMRNYELLPLGPDVKPIMNIVLRSTTGFHVGLKKRIY